jgi:RNA polymerase sigma factor (sigma-70 family)
VSNDEQWQPTEANSTDELFEKAVEMHSKRLLAIARAIVGTRASPEDVVQQAFMNLYQHRQRYDWRAPGGLLRRTVVNESLRILRQPRPVALIEESGVGASEISPPGQMIGNETVAEVRRAIERLPEHFRAALVLCEYENMSYAQIAETLSASVPQVKTWIHRARRRMAELLRPYVEEKERHGGEGQKP